MTKIVLRTYVVSVSLRFYRNRHYKGQLKYLFSELKTVVKFSGKTGVEGKVVFTLVYSYVTFVL